MDAHHKILLLIDHSALRNSLTEHLNGFHYHFLEPTDDILQKVFDEVHTETSWVKVYKVAAEDQNSA